jgi:hypothetical protein
MFMRRARGPPKVRADRNVKFLSIVMFYKESIMQVFYINNDGGGFADTISVRDGITVREFFAERMNGCDPHDYLIRVNRQPCAADQALQPDDRVSITPTKIEGAVPVA